jgi:hypothetical protein
MKDEDPEGAAMLVDMAADARAYIEGFEWCPPIRRFTLGYGIGGVLALFRAEFEHAIEGTDRELWVVAGDLPSAYFVYEGNEDPREALEQYCLLMEDWAMKVRDGESIEEAFPVEAPATAPNAQDLLSRVAFIRAEIIPDFDRPL